MYFVTRPPRNRPTPAGWTKCTTDIPAAANWLLGMFALAILFMPVLWDHFNLPGTKLTLPVNVFLCTWALSAFLSVFVHELLHIFSVPGRQRLRRTVAGWSRIPSHRLARHFPVPWITVLGAQKKSHYLIAVLAPFVVLGVLSFIALFWVSGFLAAALSAVAGANLIGSRNDLVLAADLIRKNAIWVRDRADGFDWK